MVGCVFMRYRWDWVYGLLARSGQSELLLLLGFFLYRSILDLSAGLDGDVLTCYEGDAIHGTCLFYYFLMGIPPACPGAGPGNDHRVVM
ncbi:hypothetical protein NPIL_20381 [Nephila pilipes]|uniref:Uncharacterized protein n=1 Tax=Nephila pilipes TaxID=299642 RepID=A0A8X6P292_NEPPI|nr:hypothetical protein NPIL_20381 [Nephila pilipes]